MFGRGCCQVSAKRAVARVMIVSGKALAVTLIVVLTVPILVALGPHLARLAFWVYRLATHLFKLLLPEIDWVDLQIINSIGAVLFPNLIAACLTALVKAIASLVFT